MTSEEINAIKRRLAAATPGPWYAKATDDEMHMNSRYVSTTPGEFEHDNKQGMVAGEIDNATVIAITLLQSPELTRRRDHDANTVFIAHAREDIPALVAEVERLHRELARANDPTWPKDSIGK